MTATHAVTLNGRITMVLQPMSGGSAQEELDARLALLDGRDRFALLLQRLPEGVPFDLVDLNSHTTEYIQCAGGVAERFTCEIRRPSADGNYRIEVIGRPARDEDSTRQIETIDWADHKTIVREEEVLNRNEVQELFRSYLMSGEVSAPYETRVLPQ